MDVDAERRTDKKKHLDKQTADKLVAVSGFITNFLMILNAVTASVADSSLIPQCSCKRAFYIWLI